MQIIINISNHDAELINNACCIPDILNYEIADAIINGTPLPKGKWIREERDDGVYCKCSNCGHRSLLDYDYTGFEDDPETWAMFDVDTIPLQNKNYCSSCGAMMEVE